MKEIKSKKNLKELENLIEELENKEEFTCIWDYCSSNSIGDKHNTGNSCFNVSCFLVGLFDQ